MENSVNMATVLEMYRQENASLTERLMIANAQVVERERQIAALEAEADEAKAKMKDSDSLPPLEG